MVATVTFEIEGVGKWRIPEEIATTIEELAAEVARLRDFVAVVKYQVEADIPPSIRRQTLREELAKLEA